MSEYPDGERPSSMDAYTGSMYVHRRYGEPYWLFVLENGAIHIHRLLLSAQSSTGFRLKAASDPIITDLPENFSYMMFVEFCDAWARNQR